MLTSTMPRLKKSAHVMAGAIRLQAPKLITAANAAWYEMCLPGLTGATVTLCEITDPVDCNMLEGSLGQAFTSIDSTDWEARVTFFLSAWVWGAALVRVA